MNQIQIIQVTPEQLKQVVQDAVKIELEQYLKNPEPQKEDELLTREETAELLKVSLATLDRWSKNGKMQPLKIQHKVYFKKSDIEKALKPVLR
ncbi:helix-turn-helix domain-containing protein [Flavobacterium agricola]|uniref:Helix-turn-helix domain-containing protein n=1 Tax=Flavobacterium agricola TaxID=2870839 RepID=A0ABY6M1G3_9FLAO|nr:helix-turn-helix domain-containing protein [Flavobacterium agricola]UYW02087.1 helix-turn-helix domain-containing protein [Flavobacterium agricola]